LLAVQHDAVEIALGGGEEDVVQRGEAHGGVLWSATEFTGFGPDSAMRNVVLVGYWLAS
jgi:hypothetical protein